MKRCNGSPPSLLYTFYSICLTTAGKIKKRCYNGHSNKQHILELRVRKQERILAT